MKSNTTIKSMCKRLGLSEEEVKGALERLMEKNMLFPIKYKDENGNPTITYHPNIRFDTWKVSNPDFDTFVKNWKKENESVGKATEDKNGERSNSRK